MAEARRGGGRWRRGAAEAAVAVHRRRVERGLGRNYDGRMWFVVGVRMISNLLALESHNAHTNTNVEVSCEIMPNY